MNPVAFQIGSIAVYWYGIIIVAGVLAGAYVATIQARRRQQNPEHVWDALLVCLILGIIGARIYHVFSISQGTTIGWPYYQQNPAAIFRIWEGGLGLIGAIIGGAIGMAIYAKLTKQSIWTWLDIGAHGLLLAQTIGRWGNYINQELYGPPTTLPWGLTIAAEARIAPYNNLAVYPPSTRFHPVFLYEAIWCLIGFALLWWAAERFKDWLHKGDVFALYVMWYGTGRFLIEYLRPDAWMLGPIAAAQVFSAIGFLAALGLLIYNHRPSNMEAETETAESETGVESEGQAAL